MCGIFGTISQESMNVAALSVLIDHSLQRGRDSSGYVEFFEDQYRVYKADYSVDRLINSKKIRGGSFLMGHSRLITNGLTDNQPVVSDDICLIHNGIVVNDGEIWGHLNTKRQLQIDSEVLVAIAKDGLESQLSLEEISDRIFELCEGVVSAAILFKSIGKLLLLSNNGSLYYGDLKDSIFFASEKYPLDKIGCKNVKQLQSGKKIFEVPSSELIFDTTDIRSRKEDLIPQLTFSLTESSLLEYDLHDLRRCTKCILPETMPYISFDQSGVCNYCRNYKIKNSPRPKEELLAVMEGYRRPGLEPDCIVPFSGGRDSCYGLHLIIEELQMKPITYTYDWGMVTDLGRRNISQMCAKLGVENIIVADDISKKRKNIRMNLTAWLKSPHLGMMSILTAGDKHFFRHVETIKEQTGINLNLWGVNPLEVTHFKTGFLDIPPDFEGNKVYTHGALKQLNYQYRRFKTMLDSFGYFNSSLWDTLSGEYYRSFTEKTDYYHIFDYWQWDEKVIDSTLESYDWEKAIDTSTTWRIGDGTAAFYNYVYYTVAGFTEHDTFRSNQVREGALSREEALTLVVDENKPRYENIKWYLDTLDLNFSDVIKIVNNITKLYNH